MSARSKSYSTRNSSNNNKKKENIVPLTLVFENYKYDEVYPKGLVVKVGSMHYVSMINNNIGRFPPEYETHGAWSPLTSAGPMGPPGLQFKTRFVVTNPPTEFSKDDCVQFQGSTYICMKNGITSDMGFPDNSSHWELFVQRGIPGPPGPPGLEIVQTYWHPAMEAQQNQLVSDAGEESYVSLKPNNRAPLSDPTSWLKIASKGVPGPIVPFQTTLWPNNDKTHPKLAKTRLLMNKLSDYVSLLDFGGVSSPSLTIDSTDALEIAVDALATKGGGILHIPAGIYVINHAKALASNVKIQGDGEDCTFFVCTQSDTILTTIDTKVLDGCEFSGLTFQSNFHPPQGFDELMAGTEDEKKAGSKFVHGLVLIKHIVVTSLTISNCRFLPVRTGTSCISILGSEVNRLSVQHNQFFTTTDPASTANEGIVIWHQVDIEKNDQQSDISIVDNNFGPFSKNALLVFSGNVDTRMKINKNHFLGSSSTNVTDINQLGSAVTIGGLEMRAVISNNEFDHNFNDLISVHSALPRGAFSLLGNTVHDKPKGKIVLSGLQIMKDNYFLVSDGILFESSNDRCVVANNYLSGISVSKAEGILMKENTIYETVRLNQGVRDLLFKDNVFTTAAPTEGQDVQFINSQPDVTFRRIGNNIFNGNLDTSEWSLTKTVTPNQMNPLEILSLQENSTRPIGALDKGVNLVILFPDTDAGLPALSTVDVEVICNVANTWETYCGRTIHYVTSGAKSLGVAIKRVIPLACQDNFVTRVVQQQQQQRPGSLVINSAPHASFPPTAANTPIQYHFNVKITSTLSSDNYCPIAYHGPIQVYLE